MCALAIENALEYLRTYSSVEQSTVVVELTVGWAVYCHFEYVHAEGCTHVSTKGDAQLAAGCLGGSVRAVVVLLRSLSV